MQEKTLTVRCNPQESALIEKLKEETREKSATGALLKAAEYYVSEKKDQENYTANLSQQLSEARERVEKFSEFFSTLKTLIPKK